jgi:hypothetical protein
LTTGDGSPDHLEGFKFEYRAEWEFVRELERRVDALEKWCAISDANAESRRYSIPVTISVLAVLVSLANLVTIFFR